MKIRHKINEHFKFITKRLAVMIIKYLFGVQDPGASFDRKIGSVVILGQERFGDLIVLTPLIRKLHQVFPGVKTTLIGVNESISFLYNDPYLDRVINIKRARRAERQEVLQQTYDLLFNPKDHPSVTFMFLTARINARYKIGIYHRNHIGYFNYMHFFEDALPAAEKNMAPLYFMNIPFAKQDLQPYLPDREPAADVRTFVAGFSGKAPIGINLSASNPGKEWPLSYWEKLLSEISDPVVILAMPDDRQKKDYLEKTYKNIKPAPPTRDLLDAGYLIRHLRLLITTDTALVHVAGCYNTPVVVLYRLARDRKKFPPFSEISQTHISPTSDLTDIAPQQVIGSVKDLLYNI